MRVWALIFSLLGSAFGSQFCLPKIIRYPIDDSMVYPMTTSSFDVKALGYIIGGLPETENDFAGSGTQLAAYIVQISWDLLSTPLAIKLSAARIIDAENHFVETGGFRLAATFTGNVDDPADPEAPDQKLKIELTCNGEETLPLTFTYPFSRTDLATTTSWYVAYSITGDHQLVISASNDETTLGDEESKISSENPALPQSCIDALTTESDKGGAADGATVTFGMNQDNHALATATFHPYSIVQSQLRAVGTSSGNYGYIFNGDSLPVYSGENNPVAYEFPAGSCFSTANYLFGDMDADKATSCPTTLDGIRAADCMFPASLNADEDCNSDYCCYITSLNKCQASTSKVCTLSSTDTFAMAQDARTQITIGGTVLTTSNSAQYSIVYLGEAVEFSCKPAEVEGEKNLLRKDEDIPEMGELGDFTSITFNCLGEKDTDKTTDIKALYDLVKCEAACTKPEIHDSVDIDAVFTDEDPYKPSGTVYTFTCKDGFGTSAGLTNAGTKTCSGTIKSYVDDVTVKCYQCVTPSLDDAKMASYLAATTIPTSSIVYKCDDGYSFERPSRDKRTQAEKACLYSSGSDTAALDVLQEQCLKDCPLTLPADHGLVLEFEGEVTTIESIPQDERYELKCADDTHQLSFGQEDRVECDEPAEGEEPATIEIKGCHKPCSVVDLKSTYNVESKATPEGSFTTLTADEVQFGAPLSLTGCVGDGKHFLFTEKDNTQITCSDDYYDFENDVFKNLIQCYQSCALPVSITDVYNVGDLVKNGGDDTLTAQAMVDNGNLLPNTEVQFVCEEADTTVEGTKGNTFDATCGTDGTDIKLKQCYPSCSVSEISNPNKNSIVQSHTDASATKVALAEHVDIVCSSADYKLAHNPAVGKIEEYATCELDTTGGDVSVNLAVSDSAPDPNWCLAVPKVKPLVQGAQTSNGPLSFLAHVILPSDRDSSPDFAVESVAVMAAGGTVNICTINTILDGTNEYECVYKIPDADGWQDKLKNGYGLAARSITYAGKAYTIFADSEVGGFYGGPPPLETDDVAISVVGASTVEMTWKATLVASVGMYTNAGTYDPQYTMSVLVDGEAIPALASGPEGIGALVARTNPNWGDSLEPLKTYTVKIKSSTQHGDGGTMETTFKTGNAPATVSESEVSSTARTVVIRLADTSAGGNTKITHQLAGKEATTETVLFDENKEYSIEFTDLTPLTEYTFTVTVLTDDDIPSLPASVSFKQKPNEPTPIVESDIVVTDGTAAVSFEPVEGITYILEVFQKVEGEWGTDPVATYTYPEPESEGEEDSGDADDGGNDSEQDGESNDVEGAGEDAGGEDAGGEDAGGADAGGADAGGEDAGGADAGGADAGGADAGGEDAGGADAGGADAGGADAGGADAGGADAGGADAGGADAGGEDAGGADAGGADAGGADAGGADAGGADAGGADAGGADAGGAEAGGADAGGADAGGADAGGADAGGADAGGADAGGADAGGADAGGADAGGADAGGADAGGADAGGADAGGADAGGEDAGGKRRRRKRDNHVRTHTFEGLDPNGKYKVTMKTQGTVGGETLTTTAVEYEFQLFACSKANLTAHSVTITQKEAAEVSNYFKPDPNAVLNLTCPGDLVLDERDAEGTLTKVVWQTVTCTADGWSENKLPCVAVPEPTEPPTTKPDNKTTPKQTDPPAETSDGLSGGAIAGIVIGVVVFLLIIILLVVCIVRRGGGGGTENGTSQKYSPRDNEIAADNGGESWRNPYYTDNNEKPVQENEVILVPLHQRKEEHDNYPDPPLPLEDGVEPSHQPEEKPAEAEEAKPAAEEAELQEVVVAVVENPAAENPEAENVYDTPEGEPDIGAKEANGDNVSMGSQTAKVELGDEEEGAGQTAENKV